MSDLDCHTLGSAGSLLSSASLSPHIYSSVNLDPSLCLLLIILCGLPSSRSSWWTGGCVAWAPLGDALSCSVVLWIHTLYITCIRLSGNVTCKLWFLFSVHATSIACLSILEEGSLLCVSSWGLFHCFFLPC